MKFQMTLFVCAAFVAVISAQWHLPRLANDPNEDSDRRPSPRLSCQIGGDTACNARCVLGGHKGGKCDGSLCNCIDVLAKENEISPFLSCQIGGDTACNARCVLGGHKGGKCDGSLCNCSD